MPESHSAAPDGISRERLAELLNEDRCGPGALRSSTETMIIILIS